MIPRIAPCLGPAEIRWALSASGRDVPAFEAEFAEWAGADHAICFSHGRVALIHILRGLGLEGAEILLPAYTCAAVAQAVAAAGATPRFVDVEPDDLQIAPEKFRQARRSGTRAALLTFLYGIPPRDCEALLEATDGLIRIVDLALAPGLRIGGRPAHQLGSAAIYSLNYGKSLTSLQGGMAVTDDGELAEKMRASWSADSRAPTMAEELKWRLYAGAGAALLRARTYAPVDLVERRTGWLAPIDPSARSLPSDAGTRVGAVQSAVGRCQLRRANRILRAHADHARHYFDHLRDVAPRALPPDRPGTVWTHFPVRVADAAEARDYFRGRGIAVGAPWNYAVGQIDPWRDGAADDGREAGRAAREILCLPTLASLTTEDVEYVARVARDYLTQREKV